MNLNATLFIQAGNFIITFFIIKRLFVKPCLAILNRNTNIRQTLTHEAEILEQRHTNLVIEREERWKSARYTFQYMQPAPQKASDCLIQHISPPLSLPSFSQKEKQSLIEQCSRSIVIFVENQK